MARADRKNNYDTDLNSDCDPGEGGNNNRDNGDILILISRKEEKDGDGNNLLDLLQRAESDNEDRNDDTCINEDSDLSSTNDNKNYTIEHPKSINLQTPIEDNQGRRIYVHLIKNTSSLRRSLKDDKWNNVEILLQGKESKEEKPHQLREVQT